MQLLNKRALSTVAATAALTIVALIQTESAHAFLIKRTAGPLPPAGVNPSLAAPTVIDFTGLSGDVPTTATPIGPGETSDGLNGGAKIQNISGSATYEFDLLKVGKNGGDTPRTGVVSFTFDDPRGMGYFGFLLDRIPNDAARGTISFFTKGGLAEFTMAQLLGNTAPNGNVIVGDGNYFSFFVTDDDEIFDEVRFADLSFSQGRGFLQVGNVAYQAIPTPALLPGLVGLAFGAIRKRKVEAEAEA